MAAPFSMDLRKRLFEGVRSGASRHAVARQFAVSPSAVIKLMHRHRDQGTIEACKVGGGRRPDLEPHYDRVRALVAAHPDDTIDDLRRRLAEAGIHTSRSPLGRGLLRLNLTRKKRPGTPPSKTAPTSPRHARLGVPASRASERGA